MDGAVTYRTGILLQSLAGTLTAAGELTRKAYYRRQVLSKYLEGADGLPVLGVGGQKIMLAGQKMLSFSGTAFRSVSARLFTIAGILGYTGSLSRTQSAARSAAGSISKTGALSRFFKSYRKNISGVSFSSLLTSPFYRLAQATLTAAGAVTRSVKNSRLIEATASFTGSLSAYLGQRIYGILSATGALARKIMFKRSSEGALTETGEGSATWKRLKLIAQGVLDFRGIIRKISIGGLIRRGLGRMGFNFKDD